MVGVNYRPGLSIQADNKKSVGAEGGIDASAFGDKDAGADGDIDGDAAVEDK